MRLSCLLFALSIVIAWPQLVLAAPGDLDTSFGSGGKRIQSLSMSDDGSNSIVLQPDGRLLLGGYCRISGTRRFCLSRFLANGTLDSSFGSGGSGNTALGTGDAQIVALALQDDGRVVAAGICNNGSNDDFCVARYLSNGSLDTSFGSSGTVMTPISSFHDRAAGVAIQHDGKILVAGSCWGAVWAICTVRYLPGGSLDPSFGSGGIVQTVFGSESHGTAGVLLQPDGKIVVGGYCRVTATDRFCAVRYLVNGSLDTSFDGDGVAVVDFSSHAYAMHMALQPDDRIVLAGYCDALNDSFCLTRLESNGGLDFAFGSLGRVSTDLTPNNDRAHAVAIQPDGKLLVAGTCRVGSTDDFCLARYHDDGSLDQSVNTLTTPGFATIPMGSANDSALGLVLLADGKFILAGTCAGTGGEDVCLARFQGGPFGHLHCSLDIDGDGVITASRDLLIVSRVVLGLRSSAVVGGMVFAPHATRTTWPQIRQYLISRCGMSLPP